MSASSVMPQRGHIRIRCAGSAHFARALLVSSGALLSASPSVISREYWLSESEGSVLKQCRHTQPNPSLKKSVSSCIKLRRQALTPAAFEYYTLISKLFHSTPCPCR